MYLVDTNVISAGAPGRAHRSAGLVRWMDENAGDLFISVVTVTEIARGIAKQRRTGSARRAARLGSWLDIVLHLYRGRILPFDVAAAQLAGEFGDRAQASGEMPGFADIAIAATAGSRGLTILTRNLRHFAPLGVAAVDPFVMLP